MNAPSCDHEGDIMNDFLDALRRLRRPRLLIRAARFGQVDYERGRDLRRLLGQDDLPSPDAAFDALMALEAEVEADRANAQGGYCPARHVDLLIALIGEARLLTRLAAFGA